LRYVETAREAFEFLDALRRLDEDRLRAGVDIALGARSASSKPSTARASVRTQMSVSASSRSAIVALILASMISAGTTFLPAI